MLDTDVRKNELTIYFNFKIHVQTPLKVQVNILEAKILRSMGISKSQKFNRRRLFLFLMFIKSPHFVLSSLKGKGPTQFMHIHHPFKTEYCDKLGGFKREQMHS